MSVDATIEKLRHALDAKSDADLARKLRIDKSTVSSWRSRGRVPAKFIQLIGRPRPAADDATSIPKVWSDVQERALALAMMRYSLMTGEIVRSGNVEKAMIEFRDTRRYWVVLYRAIHEIQEKRAALGVDAVTAEALLMQEDLSDPAATAKRVADELRQDFADSPNLESWR